MEIKTKVRKRGLACGALSRRAVNDINRDTMEEAGDFWHREIRPKHFRNGAAGEYGYAPRSGERGSGRAFKGSYTHLKLRKYGHSRPLVFTGESEQATATSFSIKATSTSKLARVKVRMSAPRLNFKNPHSRIDLRAELVRVSVRDRDAVRKFVQQQLVPRLKNVPAQQTTTLN